jgi:hypothetical protein
MSEPVTTPADLLDEAKRVIAERREQHGAPFLHFSAVAAVWSELLCHEVTPAQVCLMLAASKLVREAHRHHRDNLTDLVGYADCLAVIRKDETL